MKDTFDKEEDMENWVYGENQYHKYYELKTDGGTICLFANKYEGYNNNMYMAHITKAGVISTTVQDKTFNDRQRRKYKTQPGEYPPVTRPLQSEDIEYMKKKAMYAYRSGKGEICS